MGISDGNVVRFEEVMSTKIPRSFTAPTFCIVGSKSLPVMGVSDGNITGFEGSSVQDNR